MSVRTRAATVAATLSTVAATALATVALSVTPAHADDNTIVGGQPTDNPWMVQLVFKQGTGTGTYGCSGEAISAEWVLTARHCIRNTTSMNVYYSNDVKNRGPAIAVDKFVGSPKGDVALVHLSQSHPLATYGRITAGYQPRKGERGEIQGYGLMANKQNPTHLNKATVEVLGSSLDAFFGNAVHVRGVDGASNHGDSGGPLLMNGVIVGVCSTGDSADPGSDIHAGSNYANLTASLPWIQQTSGVTPNGGGDTPPGPTPTPDGSVNDDSFTMAAGQTSATFDALANDKVPAGSRVTWSGLPAGPSLYVSGRSDGTLHVYRGSYMTGTYTCTYTVTMPDGTRQSATVTLVLK